MSSEIKVDTISENTSANGVAVDGVTIKDGTVKSSISNSTQTTAGLTIDNTVSGGFGAALVFDVHRSDSGNQATAARIYPARADVWSSDAASDSDLNFQVSQDGTVATRMTVSGTGDVSIADGNLVMASGHGIDFSATADSTGTMSSELFDDYEVGTFTPTYAGSSGGSLTHVGTIGTYVKVGKIVHVRMRIMTTVCTLSGDITITGLPFTSASTTNYHTILSNFGVRFATDMPNLGVYVLNNVTAATLDKSASNEIAGTLVTGSDLLNGTNRNILQVQGSYETS